MLCRAGFPGSVGMPERPVASAIGYNFTTATLDGATLTRSSTGTFLNASTVLASAANDVARFDYDQAGALLGLLIEPARTNAFLQSETFDNASWTKVNATVTANQGTAPDNAGTADKLFENATAAAHYTQQAFNATSGVTYTFTVFAKAAERSVLGIACNPLNSGNPTSFNLATGTVGTTQASHTADIRNMGNGWYRCRVTVTATTTASYSFRVFVMSADNTFSYAGSTSNGLLVWGAQMEVGSTATSYIATTTVTVTRSADVLTLVAPAGTTTARYTFDDDSTQDVATSAGSYSAPTNLNRIRLRRVTYL